MALNRERAHRYQKTELFGVYYNYVKCKIIIHVSINYILLTLHLSTLPRMPPMQYLNVGALPLTTPMHEISRLLAHRQSRRGDRVIEDAGYVAFDSSKCGGCILLETPKNIRASHALACIVDRTR